MLAFSLFCIKKQLRKDLPISNVEIRQPVQSAASQLGFCRRAEQMHQNNV